MKRKMANEISLGEVEVLIQWIIDRARREGCVGLKPCQNGNFYLAVSDEDLLRPELENITPEVGSFSDDIEFLRSDLKAGQLSDIYVGVHLLPLLNLLVNRKNWAVMK